ncbi:MAG: hypothetical protein A2148_03480 [Chloroflexi bacterium RBG_16_68_14]|nr:MAG: hypothetical protein A2148_03480 [Chloroflexi bacterium RBG_16_68_14]
MALIAGVGALIALTYLPSEPSGEELPVQGGSYVEGVAGSPSRINPLFAHFNEVDRDLTSLIFSGLVRLGANGGVEPDLAELPKVTPDGRTYIFELRRGLFWHDGEPLDAGDVLFTIAAIQDPDFEGDPVLADLFRDVEVTASDDRTVVMTLPEPFAPFLARGATVGILPEHLLGNLDAAGLFEAPFNERPVGSGPFRPAALTPTAAVLRPFEAYHQSRPFLDRLELRFFRDDAALLNALLNEEVDGALFRPGLDPEEIALIDGDARWVRRSLHGTTYSLVYLNPEVPAFQDSSVRRALQHSLDRATLIEEVLDGQALPLDSPIVPDLWAYVGSPDGYAYDPARAVAFLDTFGWVLEGDVRVKEGVPFRFSLAVSDDPVQVLVAQEIARQWGELGIQVELQVSGASQFVEGVLLPREFEAALVTVDPGPDPDPYPLWHSTQAFGEGRNLASFSDPEVDQLLENGRQVASVAERAEDYRSFQEIFARELPAVLLSTPTYQYVVRSDLQGLSPGLLVSLSARFEDVHLWYVEMEVPEDEDG